LFSSMPRRVAAATLCLIAALEIAGCGGDDDPTPELPERPPDEAVEEAGAAADRLVFWTECERVAALTDDELDFFEDSGVDGFVCMVERLRDFGGTQDFTGEEGASLAGDQFELQRTLRDREIVERAQERGMKMYLGTFLSNYNNTATPLVEWFDDQAWSQVALPRLGDLAAAAELLGFDGLAFDQELYGQRDQVATATWEWDYPGNTHSEDEVREAARQRGKQVMETVLGEFPGVELAVYHFLFPGDWNELVKREFGGVEDAAKDLLHLDFWDGMTSVEGYTAIRFYDSIFFKTPHIGTWEAALTYDFNQVFAAFSRGFENWDYASERVHLAPFSWLNEGPDETGEFDDARSPDYVSEQLEAFRKWSGGGEFANFVYGGLDPSQYEEYRDAMEAASSPGTVDETDPAIEIDGSGLRRAITGTATDNLGIKAVRWQDDQGGSGVAEMQWEVLDGNADTGFEWEMRWSVPAEKLSPEASELTVTAEDIKGRTSAPIVESLE
jgi:hypothetical protein